MLRVRTAGGLALFSDEVPIPLPPSRRARALIAFLAAHPGPHARGELAGRFWPDVLDESARTSLRAALSELRRALGPEADALVASRDAVALEAWVDLRDEEALALGGGELLAGMDDEWVYELRRLHEHRVAEASAAAAAAAVPVPAAVLRSGVFVGRSAELARLAAVWDDVRTTHERRVVLLAGEPGVGKTRLALRFASIVVEEGGIALLGRCSEDPLAPYEPFAEVLRQAGADLDRLADGAEDPGARHRLFSAVDDVLAGVAAHRPVVLILDDLQWADRPTLLLLSFLLRSARAAPTLVIGTYRDTEVGHRTPLVAAMAELRRDGGGERVALRGLAPGEVGELASALGAPADVAAQVHERTGGNAFFAEEVLRGLTEDAETVPESVRHSVGARLARLSPGADALLAVAAVLGLSLDASVLAAVSGRDPGEVEVLLDELFDARLLRVAGGAEIEFPHALVREAVDADLNPLRRARLHREAAEALIALDEERRLEEIAHHLSLAADGRAPAYLRRAGDRALEMLAYEKAAELYGRALEAVGEDGHLLLARGDALLRAGEPGDARACFDRAAAVARTSGDVTLLGRAALGYGGLGVTILDVDGDVVRRLEEALEVVTEPVLRSELLARLAVELYYAAPRDHSEALSSEAVAVARSAGDRRAVAAALNARHVALWRPDRLEERLACADEMIVAGEGGQLELQARNWRVVDLFEAMRIDEWREEVDRHGELAARLRMPSYTWYTALWRSVDAQLAGRLDEARALREQARAEGTRAGDRNAELFAEMCRFGEAMLTRRWDELELDLLEAKMAGSPAAPAWRCSYFWILAERGALDEARAGVADLVAGGVAALPFDANWSAGVGELAECCAILGDPELAGPVYERLLPYADRAVTAGRAVNSAGSSQRLLAGLALVLGRPDEARSRHETAIAQNRAAGFTAWVEHSERALAALHSHARAGSSGVRAADS